MTPNDIELAFSRQALAQLWQAAYEEKRGNRRKADALYHQSLRMAVGPTSLAPYVGEEAAHAAGNVLQDVEGGASNIIPSIGGRAQRLLPSGPEAAGALATTGGALAHLSPTEATLYQKALHLHGQGLTPEQIFEAFTPEEKMLLRQMKARLSTEGAAATSSAPPFQAPANPAAPTSPYAALSAAEPLSGPTPAAGAATTPPSGGSYAPGGGSGGSGFGASGGPAAAASAAASASATAHVLPGSVQPAGTVPLDSGGTASVAEATLSNGQKILIPEEDAARLGQKGEIPSDAKVVTKSPTGGWRISPIGAFLVGAGLGAASLAAGALASQHNAPGSAPLVPGAGAAGTGATGAIGSHTPGSLGATIENNPKLRYYMGYAQSAIERTGNFERAKEAMLHFVKQNGESPAGVEFMGAIFDEYYEPMKAYQSYIQKGGMPVASAQNTRTVAAKKEKEDQPIHYDKPRKGYPKSKKEYADPANLKYDISSPAKVRAAWSYIHMPRNQKGYSSGQISAIKGRIRAKAKQYGIDLEAK